MYRSLLTVFAGFASLIFCLSASATIIERPLPDAAQEQQARAIFHELRCVVCEGQSVADSDAVLAVQMRAEVRRMIAQGKSAPEIRHYFRDSYGERILMSPPLKPATVLLWALPFLFLLLGAATLWRLTRREEPVMREEP